MCLCIQENKWRNYQIDRSEFEVSLSFNLIKCGQLWIYSNSCLFYCLVYSKYHVSISSIALRWWEEEEVSSELFYRNDGPRPTSVLAAGSRVELGFFSLLTPQSSELCKLMRCRWEVKDTGSSIFLLWEMGDSNSSHPPEAISAEWQISFTLLSVFCKEAIDFLSSAPLSSSSAFFALANQ